MFFIHQTSIVLSGTELQDRSEGTVPIDYFVFQQKILILLKIENMKCIKLIKLSKGHEIGEMVRIDNNEADLRVKGGNWAFAPKTEFKLYKNPEYKTGKSDKKVSSKKQSKKNKVENN
jgi:hypothetical protein